MRVQVLRAVDDEAGADATGPDRLVPPPRAVIGTPRSAAICTAAVRSSSVFGIATPSGLNLVVAGVGGVEAARRVVEPDLAGDVLAEVADQGIPAFGGEVVHRGIVAAYRKTWELGKSERGRSQMASSGKRSGTTQLISRTHSARISRSHRASPTPDPIYPSYAVRAESSSNAGFDCADCSEQQDDRHCPGRGDVSGDARRPRIAATGSGSPVRGNERLPAASSRHGMQSRSGHAKGISGIDRGVGDRGRVCLGARTGANRRRPAVNPCR